VIFFSSETISVVLKRKILKNRDKTIFAPKATKKTLKTLLNALRTQDLGHDDDDNK